MIVDTLYIVILAVFLNGDTSWVKTEAIAVGDTFTCLEVDHWDNDMNPSKNKTFFIVRLIDKGGIQDTQGFYHDRKQVMTVEGMRMHIDGLKDLDKKRRGK